MGERLGKLGPEQVGPAGGVDEEGATRCRRRSARLVPLRPGRRPKGEMVGCVARGGDRRDRELPGKQGVTVGEGAALVGERHGLARGDGVGRTRRPCERKTAADVIVVDVRLEHGGDVDAELERFVQVGGQIPLRVDDHGLLAVADEVAPVSEAGCVEGHRRHRAGPFGVDGEAHWHSSCERALASRGGPTACTRQTGSEFVSLRLIRNRVQRRTCPMTTYYH